jgi:hypothetical protein
MQYFLNYVNLRDKKGLETLQLYIVRYCFQLLIFLSQGVHKVLFTDHKVLAVARYTIHWQNCKEPAQFIMCNSSKTLFYLDLKIMLGHTVA